MRQRWRHLAFLHWAVDPLALAALLPPALELDTWQGDAFVGIVPFTIRDSRPPIGPPIPILPDFHELNFRTYVHRRGRDPGVWFFSLDAASRLAVWLARATYKLPYFHASIALATSDDGTVSFSSRRGTGDGRPRFTCSYQPMSAPSEAPIGTREFFLLERYLLYSWDGRRLRAARVAHAPYRFAPARIADLEQDLASGFGVDLDRAGAPLTHCAEDVDVRIYAPSSVKERIARRITGRVAAPSGARDALLGSW